MSDKALRPIPVPTQQLEAFCQRHHIRKLALFGSVLREDFSDTSDVDVLVEFENGQTPDFFSLYQIEQELSTLFGGRTVDLVTHKALNRHIREQVVRTAQVQYEE